MRKLAVAAALAASLSSAGCVTTLGLAVSVAKSGDEDAGSATMKRLLVGVAVDALLIAAVASQMPTFEFGGDH